MKYIRTKICIMGSGAVAHLCGKFLSAREKDVLLLADSHYGMLSPTTLKGVSFNIIPVFPTQNSILNKTLGFFLGRGKKTSLTVRSFGTSSDYQYHHPRDSVLFHYMNETFNSPQTILCLAEKHLGQRIFFQECPELLKKIKRHYSTMSQVKRMGFRDGFSPYYNYIKDVDIPKMKTTIQKIDLENRVVVTKECEIGYDYLISTIALDKLITLCNLLSDISLLGEGASFYVFETDENMETNSMVYDCDWHSPVYRVFTPRSNILIVQIAKEFWGIKPKDVAERVCRILDLKTAPEFISVKTVEKCYPLGISNVGEKADLFSFFKAHGVLPFGRFGSWEYKDLHELDWESLNDIDLY